MQRWGTRPLESLRSVYGQRAMQIHSRKKRFARQRANATTAAKRLMKRIVERTLDPYEGYLQICGIFQRHAHLHPNCAVSC
jgi:hypothetical protein